VFVVVLATLTACSSSKSTSGSTTSTSGSSPATTTGSVPPTSAAPGPVSAGSGVAAQIAAYKSRGGSPSDRVFDACQAAVAAPPKPSVDPYSLPVCSASGIAARIDAARVSVEKLSRQVATFDSPAVSQQLITDTVVQLAALVAALGAWHSCAALLKSQPYFAADHCTSEVKQVSTARNDMATVAQEWPGS
jgi:hypothetical protein